MRNVKKVVEKIAHTSKLRTNVQAQMAVGEFNTILCRKKVFHEFQFQLVHRSVRSWVKEALTSPHFVRTSTRGQRKSKREFRCHVG